MCDLVSSLSANRKYAFGEWLNPALRLSDGWASVQHEAIASCEVRLLPNSQAGAEQRAASYFLQADQEFSDSY